MAEFVLLKSYYNKHDAEMAAGLLKDAGIEVFVQSDDAGGFRPHLTLGMGNNRVMVSQENAEKALDVIQRVQDDLSEEEAQRIEEVAVHAKEPDVPKKKMSKDNLIILIPIAVALLFLLAYAFQK